MKNQKLKSQPGFTLIELVLVMLIIVIVVGLSMSSILQTQNIQVYNNTFGKLFSIVNNARSQAITGKGQIDFTDYDQDLSFTDYVTPANYGVRFDTGGPTHVRLFADINPPPDGSGTGEAGSFDPDSVYALGDDLVLDSLSLPSGITLEIFDGAAIQAPKNPSSVFYSPNYADITYEGLVVDDTPFIKIQLTEESTSVCKQIKIHKLAGIPEIELCT